MVYSTKVCHFFKPLMTLYLKETSHRHICLWGAFEQKLGRSLKPNQKDTRKDQGTRARHSATKKATPFISGWLKKSPLTSWAIFILRWEDQPAELCAKVNKMFERTVQHMRPHPEQSASHICHRSWAHKAFYSCYDAFLKCTAEIFGSI